MISPNAAVGVVTTVPVPLCLLLLLLSQAVTPASGWVVPPPIATASASTATTATPTPITTTTCLHMSQGKSRRTEARTDTFLDFINEPMPNTVNPADVTSTPELDDLAPFVRTIARAADKRKAENIVAMRVSKVTAMTSYLVICSGNSRPQNNAIAAAIMDDVEEEWDGRKTKNGGGGAEGTADSGWMLLDYGDVMVHIMTPKSRLFYDVEGQWREKGGEYMDLGDVLMVGPAAAADGRQDDEGGEAELGGSMGGLAEEDDPFWS